MVTESRDEAVAHAAACCVDGGRVVIEEYLDGPEVSLFAITDGSTVYPMQPAQDFKRIFDGDAGPNTGGMGAYTPLAWAPADLVEEVLDTVAQPTVQEMSRRGTPFAACSTSASPSPPAASGSSSSTPGSATPRPSRCWRCSTVARLVARC